MTVSAIIAGLLPIMWSRETGSEVMKTDRRSHGRRHGLIHRAHADHHPDYLRDLAVMAAKAGAAEG